MKHIFKSSQKCIRTQSWSNTDTKSWRENPNLSIFHLSRSSFTNTPTPSKFHIKSFSVVIHRIVPQTSGGFLTWNLFKWKIRSHLLWVNPKRYNITNISRYSYHVRPRNTSSPRRVHHPLSQPSLLPRIPIQPCPRFPRRREHVGIPYQGRGQDGFVQAHLVVAWCDFGACGSGHG